MEKIRLLLLCGILGVLLPSAVGFAAADEKERYLLSPKPRLCTELPGEFVMTRSVNVAGLEEADPDTRKNLLDFLREKAICVNAQAEDDAVTIVLRKAGAASDKAVPYIKRELGRKAEGYLLHLEKKEGGAGWIVIEGNDGTGLFYGIQTLKQLLRQGVPSNLHIEDYPAFAVRGVVEGFYGNPWTQEERLAQLKFYGEHKLNTYIYAPKDDPYHREKWRQPYPESELKRMKELIAAAKANKVDFVFAVSPGIDIQFSGQAGANDKRLLLEKFESLYQMGVRSFAVYYDDIEDKSGREQALLLNALKKGFVDKKGDVKPLITVPTEYFSHDMIGENGAAKPYTKAFAETADKDIRVMYTGPGVVCEGIDEADIAAVERVYGRKMAVWWNYPVNDYLLNKMALGPIYGLDRKLAAYSNFFVMNPMEYAGLSQIALQTGAAYAWEPESYDPMRAWENALKMQYGDLAEYMAVFVSHTSYMDKGWAKAGRPDAPELRAQMDAFFTKWDQGLPASRETALLYKAFCEMEEASFVLKRHLTEKALKPAKPQIELLGKLGGYGKTALRMLEAKAGGDEAAYRKLRLSTEENLQAAEGAWAKLSEEVAVYFLRESLRRQ